MSSMTSKGSESSKPTKLSIITIFSIFSTLMVIVDRFLDLNEGMGMLCRSLTFLAVLIIWTDGAFVAKAYNRVNSASITRDSFVDFLS